MEPIEAAEILTMLRASWPRLAQDEVADWLWLEDLVGCDRDRALAAARRLRDTEEHAPSWATFLRAYNGSRSDMFDQLAESTRRWEQRLRELDA